MIRHPELNSGVVNAIQKKTDAESHIALRAFTTVLDLTYLTKHVHVYDVLKEHIKAILQDNTLESANDVLHSDELKRLFVRVLISLGLSPHSARATKDKLKSMTKKNA